MSDGLVLLLAFLGSGTLGALLVRLGEIAVERAKARRRYAKQNRKEVRYAEHQSS
jgi:hypothetical protein